MAHVFSDGFDWLTDITHLGRRWDHVGHSTNMSINQSNSPYGYGGYVGFQNNGVTVPVLVKYLPNLTTFYVHWRVRRFNSNNGSTPTLNIIFRDTLTGQVAISYNDQGTISVRSGSLATTYDSVTFPLTGGKWEHFQARIVISDTAGEVEIRRNNNSTPIINLTGINTRTGTSNSYVNCVFIQQPQNASVVFHLDDFWINNTSGAEPTGWPGEIRCHHMVPDNVGATTQFNVETPNQYAGFVLGVTGAAQAANTIRWTPFTFAVGGVVTDAVITATTALAGSLNLALYERNATTGLPGTKLAECTSIVNPGIGPHYFTFTTTPTVVAGVAYAALHASGTFAVHAVTGTSGMYTSSQTFASGFPVDASHIAPQTSGGNAPVIVMNYLAQNWNAMGRASDDTTVTGTVGNADLYAMSGLPAISPTVIYGATPYVVMRKSDAGTRSGGVRVRSNTTDVTTGTIVLADGYYFLGDFMATDPATSGTWTVAAVNALQAGPIVIS